MRDIKELENIVEDRIRKTLAAKPWHNGVHCLELLFPDEKELEEFDASQLIIITRKYNILLPTCATCEAVKPNGKWLPNKGLVKAMTCGYSKRTHGYCNDCLEKVRKQADNYSNEASLPKRL